jgi:cold shock CspA family protein
MTSGTISAIVAERGFAFIQAGDGRAVFFHRSDCEPRSIFDALAVGDVLEYELVAPTPPKGERARNVRYPTPKEVIASMSNGKVTPATGPDFVEKLGQNPERIGEATNPPTPQERVNEPTGPGGQPIPN